MESQKPRASRAPAFFTAVMRPPSEPSGIKGPTPTSNGSRSAWIPMDRVGRASTCFLRGTCDLMRSGLIVYHPCHMPFKKVLPEPPVSMALQQIPMYFLVWNSSCFAMSDPQSLIRSAEPERTCLLRRLTVAIAALSTALGLDGDALGLARRLGRGSRRWAERFVERGAWSESRCAAKNATDKRCGGAAGIPRCSNRFWRWSMWLIEGCQIG